MKRIIAQGAEAIIELDENEEKIIKKRIKKNYRHPILDEKIRKSRTKRESKLLEKAREIAKINVPKIIKQDKFEIEIEFIKGEKLSETLNKYREKEQFELMKKIAEQVAKLHKNNIIHGDLTTSNTIFNSKDKKVYIIDFGLGFVSQRIEDKAVDLHLIRQALEAKHFQNWQKLFENFLIGYSSNYPESNKVLEQLKKVESRGRYKH